MIRTDSRDQKLDKFLVKHKTIFDETQTSKTESQMLTEETEQLSVGDRIPTPKGDNSIVPMDYEETFEASKNSEHSVRFS